MLKITNSKGSTFVTTLVATLVFMVIAVSIITRLESSFKSSNFNAAKINELVGMANLKVHLANLATCQSNLKDKSLNPSGELTLPSILDGSGNPLFTSGQKVPQSGLKVTDIKLRYPAGNPSAVTSTSPAPAKGYSLPTRVEISFQKEKLSFGSKIYTATMNLPVLVDSSAKILDCDTTTSAFDLSGLCSQVGGTFDAASSICTYPTDCTEIDPAKLASGKCLKEGVASLKLAIADVQAALTTPTPAPKPAGPLDNPTPSQAQAWSTAEPDLVRCVDNGGIFTADKISCNSAAGITIELEPSTGRVGRTFYSDPAVAEYLFKKTQELLLAKFGH